MILRRIPRRLFAAVLIVCGALGPTPGRSAAGQSSVSATKVVRAPRFDGTLDDPLWRLARPLDAFRQVQPELDAPASERTQVRVLYDSANLYVGIACTEAPAEILAHDLSHDSRDTSSAAPSQGNVFESDDYVAVTFDSFGRGQEGYYFAVNPAGAWADGLVYNTEHLDLSWDTVWFNRAHRDATGWTVEMVIPLKSMSFDAADTHWRVNFERMLRRRQEIDRWTAVSRSRQVYSLTELGPLTGLADLHQGVGIDFEPYLLLRDQGKKYGGPTGNQFRRGADLVWNILPSLEGTLTVNTDFAQTDVDQRQVNLTRFPLFYPEKRDFFLRDEANFSFGGINSTTLVPYYSRRIGLANGVPVDLPIGAKLAGRAGPLTIGLLNVLADASPGVPRRDLSVARVAYQMDDESTMGMLLTNGDPRGPGRNTLLGVDYNWTSRSWIPNNTVLIHAWVMGTHSDAKGGDGNAASLELNYPNDPWNLDLFARRVTRKFDPALGFVQQTGVWQFHLFGDRFWHPNGAAIRDVDLGTHADFIFDLNHREISEDIDLSRLTLTNPAGDNFTPLWLSQYADRPVTPFTVAPGVVIHPGFYRWYQGKLQLVLSPSRPLSGLLYFRAGNYYDGTETEEKGSVLWRPNAHFNLSAGYDLYQVKLPAGHFAVRNLSASVAWYWSPHLFGTILGQYDTQSRLLGIDYRIQWIVAPGRNVYLVVDHGDFNDPNGGWQNRGTQATVKIGWTWQF